MKKLSFLFVVLFGLMFLSCASTNVATFVNPQLVEMRVKVKDNAKLRKMFDEFNELYFDNQLYVDCIGFYPPKSGHSRYGTLQYGIQYSDGSYKDGFTEIIALVKPYEGYIDKNGNSCDIYAANNLTLEGILLHEMVHLEFQLKRESFYDNQHHGPEFKKRVEELNKLSNYKYKVPLD